MADFSRILPGVTDFQQNGGTLGTDAIRVQHDGTDGTIQSLSGDLVLVPEGTNNLVLDSLNWPNADGSNGQVLQTNGTSQLSFVTLTLDNLGDVIITGPSLNQLLRYDGTNWINQAVTIGTGDVTGPGSSTANGIARYNGTTGKIIKDSSVTVNDSGEISGAAITVTTQVTTPSVIRGSAGAATLFTDAGANSVTLGGTASTIVVAGNLQVDGTTTTVNSQTLEVADKNIVVNHGGNTAGATASGINIEGDSAAIVGYFRSASDNGNLEFKAPTGSVLTLDVNANTTIVLSSASTAQVLRYNGTNFVNASLSLDDLSDAVITAPSNNQFLRYDGTNWINQTVSVGTGDVTGPGSATDNAAVRFDGTTGKLVKNSTVTIDNSGNINGSSLTVTGNVVTPTVTTASNANLVLDPNGTGAIEIGATLITTSNGNLSLDPNGTGRVILDGLTYPSADGTNGQVLTTNGSGVVSFTTVASGGGDPIDKYFNSANNSVDRLALSGTTLTDSYQYTGTGRAIITSINVCNTDGTTEYEIDALIRDNSGAADFYIAKGLPVPADTSLELLRRPKVLEASDRLKFQANSANKFEIVTTIATLDTNTKLFNAFLSAGSGAVGTNVTVYSESGTAGSVVESILLANDQVGVGGVEVTVTLNNGTNDTKLVSTLNVPPKSTVDICDGPKFLPNGGSIKIQVSDADRCDITVSGRKL